MIMHVETYTVGANVCMNTSLGPTNINLLQFLQTQTLMFDITVYVFDITVYVFRVNLSSVVCPQKINCLAC